MSSALPEHIHTNFALVHNVNFIEKVISDFWGRGFKCFNYLPNSCK